MMLRYLISVLLVPALFVGCSSIQTAVEKSPDVDFESYKTWEWMPGERPLTGDPRIDGNTRGKKYITAAIERQMDERGYEKSAAAPELYVDFHVTIRDESNATVINNYCGEAYYPDYELALPGIQDTYENAWTEGSLLVLIFDANNKTMIWRGLARTDVDTQGPFKDSQKRIDSAVEKLLKKFPKAK